MAIVLIHCFRNEHITYTAYKARKRINTLRIFKHKFDRKSPETTGLTIMTALSYRMTVSSIRKEKLIKKTKTARIAPGATKLNSLSVFYSKVRWNTLERRQKSHRLTLFYKIRYNNTPYRLSSLVRNFFRYHQSFLPSTMRLESATHWIKLSTLL